jgi:hypothetical protein
MSRKRPAFLRLALRSAVLLLLVCRAALAAGSPRVEIHQVQGNLGSTPRAAAAAATVQVYCLDDVLSYYITVTGGPPSTTVTFDVNQTNAGIYGFSLVQAGPFGPTITVQVPLDASGSGRSADFFAKALMAGLTDVYGFSPQLGFTNLASTAIIRVASVELVPVDAQPANQLDTNPNEGGGKRLFPDRMALSETAPHRRVKVQATISPAFPDLPVVFRTFDVDDPSTDMVIDPNGTTGSDNRGTVDDGGVPQEGKLDGASDFTDGMGVAEQFLTVTMHPGDNFKVAAGCRQANLDAMTVSGTDLKDRNGAVLPTNQGVSTLMLTVWRRLHMEVDTMGPVSGNTASGTVKSAAPARTAGQTDLSLDLASSLDFRYQGGRIKIDSVGGFKVVDNGRSSVTVEGTLESSAVQGKAFTLVDDDDFNGDDGVNLDGDEGEQVAPLSDTFKLLKDSDQASENVFAPAYIRPVFDGGGKASNNTSDEPFALNVSGQAADLRARLLAGQDSLNDEADDFWIAYLQIGYQAEERRDMDPVESVTGGEGIGRDPGKAVSNVNATKYTDILPGAMGAMVYVETDRDADATSNIFTFRVRTAPHEVGHQFGLLGHDPDYGIMNDRGTPLVFVPAHINMLRWRTKSPGIAIK